MCNTKTKFSFCIVIKWNKIRSLYHCSLLHSWNNVISCIVPWINLGIRIPAKSCIFAAEKRTSICNSGKTALSFSYRSSFLCIIFRSNICINQVICAAIFKHFQTILKKHGILSWSFHFLQRRQKFSILICNQSTLKKFLLFWNIPVGFCTVCFCTICFCPIHFIMSRIFFTFSFFRRCIVLHYFLRFRFSWHLLIFLCPYCPARIGERYRHSQSRGQYSFFQISFSHPLASFWSISACFKYSW